MAITDRRGNYVLQDMDDLRSGKITVKRHVSITVAQISGGNLLADITMVLLEYQKLAGKEAREDNKSNQLQLLRKSLEELKYQIQKISDELRERGDSPTQKKLKKKN